MAVKRGLLTIGNGKLGQAIHVWNLPAISTCPGRTPTCSLECYATKRRFRFASVVERLNWNYQESLKPGFADAMAAEVKKKGCQVLRIHGSGDMYNAEYAEKWLWVMRKRPKPRYYFYTRSFRIAEIVPVLEQMAALRCCRVWYSLDRDTGIPESIPPGVRLAYLQVSADEQPTLMHLRFTVRSLRNRRLSLPMLCPEERGTAENCGDCGACFK